VNILSGLDRKGSKFPNGINVPNNKMFIDDTAITATAAEINRGALKKVTGPLGTASDSGGIFAWQNPESGPILVQHLVINVTTVASAACTIDCGTVNFVTPGVSSGNLIDGLNVNAATGTFTNDESAGTNGKPFKRLAPGKWVTGSKATGSAAGLEGTYEIYYQVL
jgi:hypothetical protein